MKKLFSLALIWMCGMHLYAQVGGAAVVFLQIEPDARAAAMGNSGTAAPTDANAVFWNPAALSDQSGTQIGITHSKWLPKLATDLYYENLVGKYEVKNLGTLGAHVTFLNLGEHERRGPGNEDLGTFRSYDLAAGVSLGRKITKNFSLGTGARFIYSNLDSGGGTTGSETHAGVGVGFDLAGLYKKPLTISGMKSEVSAGFNLNNMGPKISYSDNGQADPIPTNMRMGVSGKMEFDEYNSLRLTADATKLLVRCKTNPDTGRCAVDEETGGFTYDPFYKAIFSAWSPIKVNTAAQGQSENVQTLSLTQQLTYGLGMEYAYKNFFSIRGGYFYENPQNGNRNFLSVGAGIKQSILNIDFSYIVPIRDDDPLAGTPRFSLMLNL